jgi:hypothetical protein
MNFHENIILFIFFFIHFHDFLLMHYSNYIEIVYLIIFLIILVDLYLDLTYFILIYFKT